MEAGSYVNFWHEVPRRFVALFPFVLVCILMVSQKDRKHIVKVLKPYIETIAKNEDAQYILFTAFDIIEYVMSNCHYIFR